MFFNGVVLSPVCPDFWVAISYIMRIEVLQMSKRSEGTNVSGFDAEIELR